MNVRERIYLNSGWLFDHVWRPEMAQMACMEDNLKRVRLPHTNREIPLNYGNEEDYQEVCGYRRHLNADKAWEGKKVTVTFEGAAHEATLFVNGKRILIHRCGYTAFSADIQDYLVYGGDNILCVRLDTRETLDVPPFGNVIDYLTFGGLYREVYLEIHEKISLEDVFCMSEAIEGDRARMFALVTCGGKKDVLPEGLSLHVEGSLSDTAFNRGHAVKREENLCFFRDYLDIKGHRMRFHIPVTGFKLWSPEEPYLYDITFSLWQDRTLLDRRTVRMGFREAVFMEEGFFLNGRPYKIRGLDRHQMYPYVGYAMPASIQKTDADIMKYELALNAVRTSHYPQSHHFIDRCDEIGLLVFMEFPGWQHIGGASWQKQAEQNVREMIRQYRNHTSIILWGVRINESPDNDALYTNTNKIAHALDPFRPTGGVRNFAKSSFLEDVYTYNDFVHNGTNQGAEPKSKITSDMSKAYLVTEYCGHMYPTKPYDDEPHRISHARRHATVLNAVNQEYNIAGSFGWCFADYNTHHEFGSGDGVCYHGVMDMFRNPKLAAYVYKSQRDPEEGAVLKVGSTMDIGDYPAGCLSEVDIYTNADEVVFYKDDEAIISVKAADSPYTHLAHGPIVMDDFVGNQLVAKEGMTENRARDVKELFKAISRYGVDNIPLKERMKAFRLVTFGDMTFDEGVRLFGKYVANWGGKRPSYRFEARVDNKTVAVVKREPVKSIHLRAITDTVSPLVEGNSYDVRAVRLRMEDQNGNVLPYYQEPVKIRLSGVGTLIGPDVISLKGGMGGFYIKTAVQAGSIHVTLGGSGFEPVSLSFTVICR